MIDQKIEMKIRKNFPLIDQFYLHLKEIVNEIELLKNKEIKAKGDKFLSFYYKKNFLKKWKDRWEGLYHQFLQEIEEKEEKRKTNGRSRKKSEEVSR